MTIMLPVRTAPDLVKLHEGCTLTAIKDSVGWSIGWGRNDGTVRPGDTCTQDQADAWFEEDFERALAGARSLCGNWKIDFDGLAAPRAAALVDMAYEMGEYGLGAFHGMLTAIVNEMWISASAHGLNSLWAKEVPTRATMDMNIILTGCWPDGEST